LTSLNLFGHEISNRKSLFKELLRIFFQSIFISKFGDNLKKQEFHEKKQFLLFGNPNQSFPIFAVNAQSSNSKIKLRMVLNHFPIQKLIDYGTTLNRYQMGVRDFSFNKYW